MTPNNPLGAKSVGEAGTIAAPPVVVNAVVDALSPFDVTDIDISLTSETVWRAVTPVNDPNCNAENQSSISVGADSARTFLLHFGAPRGGLRTPMPVATSSLRFSAP